MKARLILNAALSMSMALGPVLAKAGGVDGVEFQPVPVNIANRCSAVILKGTNKYRGYAFKLPQVVLSMDKNYEDLFEIIPKGNGQYTLRFGLYFPLTEDAVEIRNEKSNLVVNTCDDNVILADLNESEAREAALTGKKDKDSNGTVFDNKIHTLSPLPMSSLEISIDGFQSMTKMIGTLDNNLLNYQNRDLVADFLIPDEATYEELKAHLTGRMGLSVNIKMNFAAKSSNGRVELDLDLKNVADSLEAAAGGRADVKQLLVAEADLRAFMAKAMTSMNLNMRTEQGDDDNFNRLAYQVMERIIAANLSAVPMIPGQTWNPNACINNPTGMGCQGGMGGYYPGVGTGGYQNNYGNPQSTGDGSLNGPPQVGLGTPGPVLGGYGGNPDPSARYFKVGAVLNVLRTSSKQHFVWENLGKRENHSYTTSVVMRGDLVDPGYKTMNAIAGGTDEDAASLPVGIKAGQTVAIKIPASRVLENNFVRRTTYLNKDELRRQGFATSFGNLQEAMSKNLLQEEIHKERNGYVAVYRKNADYTSVGRWWREMWDGEDMSLWKYLWGIEELQKTTRMSQPADLDLEAGMLDRLPLRVTFSKLGTRFKLSDLVRDSDKWTGRFEDGQIFLVAKRDLGYMKIRNYDKVSQPSRQAEKYLFEEREPVLKKRPANGQSLSDLRQRVYMKYSAGSGAATEKIEKPDLTGFQIKKSVFVIMARVDDGSETPNREEVRTTVEPVAHGDGSPNPVLGTQP